MFARLLGNAGVIAAHELDANYGTLLGDGEVMEIGFKVMRDVFVFTNRRLILVDKQGITGRKSEYLSIPYSKISMYSIETAGHFDLEAELKIWVSSYSKPIEKKFNRKVNVYDLQKVLATHV